MPFFIAQKSDGRAPLSLHPDQIGKAEFFLCENKALPIGKPHSNLAFRSLRAIMALEYKQQLLLAPVQPIMVQ